MDARRDEKKFLDSTACCVFDECPTVTEIPMYEQSKLSELIRFARVEAGSTVIDSPGRGGPPLPVAWQCPRCTAPMIVIERAIGNCGSAASGNVQCREAHPPNRLPVQLELLPYHGNKPKTNQTPDQLRADLMADTVASGVTLSPSSEGQTQGGLQQLQRDKGIANINGERADAREVDTLGDSVGGHQRLTQLLTH